MACLTNSTIIIAIATPHTIRIIKCLYNDIIEILYMIVVIIIVHVHV